MSPNKDETGRRLSRMLLLMVVWWSSLIINFNKLTLTINVQVLMNALWFGMSTDEAVQSKRIHDQLMPDYVQYEEGFDQVSCLTCCIEKSKRF